MARGTVEGAPGAGDSRGSMQRCRFVPSRGLLAISVFGVVGKLAFGTRAFEEPCSTCCGRIGREPSSRIGQGYA